MIQIVCVGKCCVPMGVELGVVLVVSNCWWSLNNWHCFWCLERSPSVKERVVQWGEHLCHPISCRVDVGRLRKSS